MIDLRINPWTHSCILQLIYLKDHLVLLIDILVEGVTLAAQNIQTFRTYGVYLKDTPLIFTSLQK